MTEVTDRVQYAEPVGGALPLTRCVCGASFALGEVNLLGAAEPMPCCGARLRFDLQVKVYEE
jgi:hypothetical protein